MGDGTVEAPARAWLIEPAGYEAHGRDAAVVAAGAWVRDLCAVIHGPTAAEGKRLTRRLMRTTAVGAEDDDEDDGDYEAGARAVVADDGAAARAVQPFRAGVREQDRCGDLCRRHALRVEGRWRRDYAGVWVFALS